MLSMQPETSTKIRPKLAVQTHYLLLLCRPACGFKWDTKFHDSTLPRETPLNHILVTPRCEISIHLGWSYIMTKLSLLLPSREKWGKERKRVFLPRLLYSPPQPPVAYGIKLHYKGIKIVSRFVIPNKISRRVNITHPGYRFILAPDSDHHRNLNKIVNTEKKNGCSSYKEIHVPRIPPAM